MHLFQTLLIFNLLKNVYNIGQKLIEMTNNPDSLVISVS